MSNDRIEAIFELINANKDVPETNLLEKIQAIAVYGEDAGTPEGWAFDGWTPANPELTGLNGLTRTNFFNGRYLDAEAFKRDQQWVGERDKLLAQTEHAGIAWGLGLKYPQAMIGQRGGKTPAAQVEIDEDEAATEAAEPEDLKVLISKMRAHMPSGESDEPADTQAREVLNMIELRAEELEQRASQASSTKVPRRYAQAQFHIDNPVWLKPGLAFDSEGRPIQVDDEFEFTFASLLEEYANNPRIAVPPRTRFQPCMCIESAPGTGDAGPSPERGAYILVIAPREYPKGHARVYGDPCHKDARIDCEADAWRGGFTLSLVKFPAPEADVASVKDTFALRGTMAAYYFDTWEKRWESRWKRPFAEDDRFCHGMGPFQRTPGAVPLAFVWVGSTNQVLFVDPWIPRRYQISSASRAWEALVRGAPTPSASVARRHQFQCQFDESLEWWKRATRRARPPQEITRAGYPARHVAENDDTPPWIRPRPNLYELGFRHIPPCGFLPVEIEGDEIDMLRAQLGRMYTGQQRELMVTHMALKLGREYFAGTNVFTRARVAVYEDDIFEEMQRVREKDPIRLRRINRRVWRCIDRALNPADRLLTPGQRSTFGAHLMGLNVTSAADDAAMPTKQLSKLSVSDTLDSVAGLIVFGLIQCLPYADESITFDALANHHIELVDVIAPLYGREFVGEYESKDYQRVAKELAKYGADPRRWEGRLPTEQPTSSIRHFVFYVKRRVLLTEWIYAVVDTLLTTLDKISPQGGMQLEHLSAEDVAAASETPSIITGIVNTDAVIDSMVEATVEEYPELRAPATLEAFDATFDRARERLIEEGLDEASATRRARARAIDTMSEAYDGFNAYKGLLMVSDETVERLHERIKANAGDAPAGESHRRTMLERAFYSEGYQPGVNEAANDAIAEARRAFAEREVEEVEEARGPVRMGELLRRRGADLERLVGEQAPTLERNVVREGRRLVRAINNAAGSDRLAKPEFWKLWDKSLASEEPTEAALHEFADDESDAALVANLGIIASSLGEEGLVRVMNRLRRPNQ